MEKFKGVSLDTFNKYRLEFVDLVEKEPELFDQMMLEMLTSFNTYCTREYQNFFNSRIYDRKKEDLYEKCIAGLKNKNVNINDDVVNRLNYELTTIENMKYLDYFYIVKN